MSGRGFIITDFEGNVTGFYPDSDGYDDYDSYIAGRGDREAYKDRITPIIVAGLLAVTSIGFAIGNNIHSYYKRHPELRRPQITSSQTADQDTLQRFRNPYPDLESRTPR